ncbi:MAG: response regulator [Deltaproteobacteria bacterium]|nr:response regulator [Deltaproteobacteria bacterium]
MKKKILVVDDNRVLLNFIDRMLRKEGHEVAIAGDAFAALNILTDFVPDVMFIDFIMPTIDGDKLCRIVRKMRHMENCYIVFITAAAAELDFDYTKVGANACIAKGSFESVAGYIKDAIRESDMPHRNSIPKAIMGLESINARQMTKELLSRHRHLQTILERMAQGILEIQSDKVVYANSAAIALFEMSAEDIIASYPPDLFEESMRSEIEAIMNPDNSLSEFDNRDLNTELNGRQVLIECLPVGTEPTAILLITDVTHKKRLETKFNEFRRLEAIGTLAGGVAHDINNLLMGIQGNTSLMLLEIEKDAIHFNSVKNIERCVKKGSRLTKELLGFARGGKYLVRHIDLNGLIEKNIYIFDDTNRIINLHQECQDNLWAIEADEKQIEQVLETIFVNACQAIGTKRGEISIKTENISLTKDFTEQFEVEEGDYVKLSLEDNGGGIDNSDKDRIFEPFFTTKEIGTGTGLGLAAAFGIIKNHCGIINFSSKKDQGTTFNIYLPAITQE